MTEGEPPVPAFRSHLEGFGSFFRSASVMATPPVFGVIAVSFTWRGRDPEMGWF